MSLFSPFDNFFYYTTYFYFFLFFWLFVYSVSKINCAKMVFLNFISFIMSFFYSISNKSYKNWMSMLFSIFFCVMVLNMLSVGSWNFPATSSVGVVLMLSMLMWCSNFFFFSLKSFNMFLSHMVPEGTPSPLVVFIFLIEVVSSIIRPITLMIRLVANILAGHVLMILLSSLVLSCSYFFPLYIGLNLVEMAVSVIQSYIFVTMLTLYLSEME